MVVLGEAAVSERGTPVQAARQLSESRIEQGRRRQRALRSICFNILYQVLFYNDRYENSSG